MKRVSTIILLALLLAFGSSQAQTPVEAWGQLRVEGSKIVNQHGTPVQLQGMSLFWSMWSDEFYEWNTVKWLRDDWCTNVVRAAIGVEDSGGVTQGHKEANMERLRKVIDASIDLNMYVVVDWHSHFAHQDQQAAVDFFSEVAQEYGSYPNIIYETFNEPEGIDWNSLKGYHEAVINAIRAHDPNNIIVCGTPTWSQDVDQVAHNPVNGTNIAYALHYYSNSHGASLRAKADQAVNAGRCIFVTEFGTTNFNGNGPVNTGESDAWFGWMDHHGISHCNWNLGNKDENSTALVPTAHRGGYWTDAQLTTSGRYIRNRFKSKCPSYGGTGNSYVSIPGRVEAESYSSMDGVQTEVSEDLGGGSNVGYIDAGDWLEYQVLVQGEGTYDIDYRVASDPGAGEFIVLLDGVQINSITVGATGGWQDWDNESATATLTTGVHTFRIEAIAGGWNLNYIDFSGSGLSDCNGDADGTALIDECDVCSGGLTGVSPGDCGPPDRISCEPGYSRQGIYENFTTRQDPWNLQGAVFKWGEILLGGDANPEFQSQFTRNIVNKKLDILLSQGENEFQPFGFSFGGTATKPKTIDLSGEAHYEFEFTNNSSYDVNISLGISDNAGHTINTSSKAVGEPFADAWKYGIAVKVYAGQTIRWWGDFTGGVNADYAAGAYTTGFDMTKVSNILLTVSNLDNSGKPNYTPYEISDMDLSINYMKVGDCSGAHYLNDKDCHGDEFGNAYVDDCGVCAAGNTGVVANSSCEQDCNGDWDGTATLDVCDRCTGGETGLIAETDVNKCDPVGVNESNSGEDLLVYPNPTHGQVHLSEAANWKVRNVLGAIIQQGHGKLIDISALQNGMYLIETNQFMTRVVKE